MSFADGAAARAAAAAAVRAAASRLQGRGVGALADLAEQPEVKHGGLYPADVLGHRRVPPHQLHPAVVHTAVRRVRGTVIRQRGPHAAGRGRDTGGGTQGEHLSAAVSPCLRFSSARSSGRSVARKITPAAPPWPPWPPPGGGAARALAQAMAASIWRAVIGCRSLVRSCHAPTPLGPRPTTMSMHIMSMHIMSMQQIQTLSLA